MTDWEQRFQAKRQLRDAERRMADSALAALWWEIVFALKLDRLVEWLARKGRKAG